MKSVDPSSSSFPWRTALVVGGAVVIAILALVAYLRTLGGVGGFAERGLDVARFLATNAPTIAERFRQGTITHTFRESIPRVRGTQGDILEVAVSRSDETVARSDARRIAWDWVYLGTTVAEIRVPVTYRYHVRLSDTWRLNVRDQVCLVLAPPIRASLPPAIHTDAMEKRAESGWARFDKQDLLAEVERSLTPTLSERAMDADHLALVREAGRQSVAAFVRNWLIREDHWRKDRFTAIVVVFADEVSGPDLDPERLAGRPTITLE